MSVAQLQHARGVRRQLDDQDALLIEEVVVRGRRKVVPRGAIEQQNDGVGRRALLLVQPWHKHLPPSVGTCTQPLRAHRADSHF